MTWSDILLGTIGAIVLIAALLFSVALVWSAVLTNSEYKQEERHWLELHGNARRGEAEVLGLARPRGVSPSAAATPRTWPLPSFGWPIGTTRVRCRKPR